MHCNELLSREFYKRSVRRVARSLLGMRLVSRIDGVQTSGWIVETEAYLPTADSACHAARGRTRRNEVMFGPPGHAYVYAIHAKWCLNAVADRSGVACAALIRAIQPLDGVEEMMARRNIEQVRDLCRGPARLTQALGIGSSQNGHDLTLGHEVWIDGVGKLAVNSRDIKVTERIGVTSAKQMPLRYVVRGNPFVSGPKRLSS